MPVEMFAKTLAKVDSVSERESLVLPFLVSKPLAGWRTAEAVAGPVSPKQDKQRRESLKKLI